MEVDFSAISRQIDKLSKLSPEAIQDALSPNDARELRKNLNKLSVALESPGDIVDRIVYAVRPPFTRSPKVLSWDQCLDAFVVLMP